MRTDNFESPYSLESEQSILGGLLIDNGAIDRLGDFEEQAFFTEAHRLIYRAIRKQAALGKAWDVITVAEMLDAHKKLDAAGGLAYIGNMASEVPSSANIKRYADIVREHFTRRLIMQAAAEMNEIASQKNGDIAVAMDKAQSRLLAITEGVKTDEPRNIADIMRDHFNVLEQRMDGGKKAISTGLEDLDAILNGGWHRGQVVVIAARPSMGKELTNNSKVLLSNGEFKRMGDMQMNDSVASVDGKASKVIGIFHQGIKPVYKITFADGRSVEAGLDHQWEIMYRDWDCARVLTTKDLIQKLECKRYENRLYIPYPSGDFGCDIGLSVNPYLLGVLLGDGNFTQSSVRLSTSYEYLKEKIEPYLMGAKFTKSGDIDYRLTTAKGLENKLLDSIKELGLMGKYSHEKFIPAQYLSASKNSRLELMRGLIDTDGTVEKSGAMTYTTTSETMAKQFQSLARSLGAYASMSSRITKYPYKGEIKDGKRSYRICVSCNDYSEFVTIPHKLARVKEKSREKNLNVTSIEYIGDFDCQCISVSHKRELYIADEYTVTHNTALCLHHAISSAIAGFGVLFLSMEMVASELADRAIAAYGRVNLGNLLKADMSEAEWSGVTVATGKMQDISLHVLDRSGLNFYQVATYARRHKRKHGLDILVLDYLQLMAGDEGDKRHSQIEEITRNLKTLAKELDIAVLLLSQLSRKTEDSRRPKLSHLRDSGSIEQDADVVLFIHREEVDNPETEWKNYADIHIAKNRQGALGRVGVTYIGHQVRFENFGGAMPNWDAKPDYKSKRGMD